MDYLKSLSTLAGVIAAATLTSAVPAQAESLSPEAQTMIVPLATEGASALEVVPADVATTADLLAQPVTPAPFAASDETLLSFETADLEATLNGVLAQEITPEAVMPEATPTEPVVTVEPVVTESAMPEATSTPLDTVAQVPGSRRGYDYMPSAYLGAAGNVGFGNPESAIGDFGVNVISKISLGPRFALRPGFIFSERFTNFAVPLTYNFPTVAARGIGFQPYLGAGVDVPFNGETGLLVTAGADVPISRSFTLNAATNVRATSGFGLGISLGIGYNLPLFFD